MPNRKIAFTWDRYAYRNNFASESGWAGYAGQVNGPQSGQDNTTYVDGVVQVDDIDTSTNVSRRTNYTRVLPQPVWTDMFLWGDTHFYVATDHPDGRATVQYFAEPLSKTGKAGSYADSPLEDQMQTLAHLKHILVQEREYGDDVDWAADAPKAAALSQAYRISIHDRFDVRGIGDGAGVVQIFGNPRCVPYATRVRTYNRETGVMEVTEKTDWDAANYSWNTTRKAIVTSGFNYTSEWLSLANQNKSYLEPDGTVARSTTTRTTTQNRAQWQFGLLKTEQAVTGADSTGNSTDPQGGVLPPKVLTYDFEAGKNLSAGRVLTEVVGTTSKVTTSFAYKDDAANLASAQLDHVDVTGTSDLFVPVQGVGITAYGYDAAGYLSLIQPKGVDWTLQQSSDGFGRPSVQTDANGRTTTYGWDAAGRLHTITPQGMAATTIDYATDSLGATVTRGLQKTEYRYNGFGQLVLIRRWTAEGVASHQVIGYFPDGRKRYESVWLAGAGSEQEALDSAPTFAKTSYEYNDPQLRVTKVTSPTGVITQTAYSGLTRTVTVNGEVGSPTETTTFKTDSLGRLVELIDALGNSTAYAYDRGNRIGQVTQYAGPKGTANPQTRTWGYHELGWVQSLMQPESGITTYQQFTVAGKPMQTVYQGDGSGPARSLNTTYDSLMRVLGITSSDGSVDQNYVFDKVAAGGRDATSFGEANGKLIYARDKGIERYQAYSGTGGALSAIDTRIWTGGAVNSGTAWILPQTMTTDAYGQRTQATAGHSVVDYAFDSARGVLKGASRNGLPLAFGVLDDVSWGLNLLTFGNNVSTAFTYEADQVRLHSMENRLAGGAKIGTWTYAYYVNGRLKSDGEDSYEYDALGRLSKAVVARLNATTGLPDSGQVVTQSLAYDAFGNLIQSLATGALPSELTPGYNLNNFAFNASELASLAQRNRLPRGANGNPTGAEYDAQGNLTSFSTRATTDANNLITLGYDALARVVSMSDKKRPGYQEKYSYSPEGLRTVVEEYQDSVLQKRRVNLYNDARQLVTQYQAIGAATLKARSSATLSAKSAKGSPTVMAATYKEINAVITAPASGSTFTKGQAISFKATTDYGTTNKWDFGDGTTVAGISAIKSFSAAGVYAVSFTSKRTGYITGGDGVTVVIQDPSAQTPVISSFVCDKSTIIPGQTATLSWGVTGATSLSMNGSTITGTSLVVTPIQTTTYTLTATNAAGSVTKTLMIAMPPLIVNFTANPEVVNPGDSVTLSWNVPEVATVTLDGVVVAASGSLAVTPSVNQSYVLKATNSVGTTTRTLLIPTSVDSGGLSWLRDIVYMGAKEVGEFDANGLHVTLVDHLGTPRVVTRADGSVESRQKFLPFGQNLDRWGTGATAKGFTNHEQTETNGTIYMQARFYLPMWGRFASPDPARDQHFEETQSWNIYSYVQNNPIQDLDPTGMMKTREDKAKEAVEKQKQEETKKSQTTEYRAITSMFELQKDGDRIYRRNIIEERHDIIEKDSDGNVLNSTTSQKRVWLDERGEVVATSWCITRNDWPGAKSVSVSGQNADQFVNSLTKATRESIVDAQQAIRLGRVSELGQVNPSAFRNWVGKLSDPATSTAIGIATGVATGYFTKSPRAGIAAGAAATAAQGAPGIYDKYYNQYDPVLINIHRNR